MKSIYSRCRPYPAVVLLLLCACSIPALAQTTDFGPPGTVSDATMMVSTMFGTYKRLALVVSAICALVGAVKVYGKIIDGGSESRRGILVWFGASIFSLFVMNVIDKLFL